MCSYYTCVCNLNPRSHWKYAKYIFVLKNDKIIWRFMYIIFEEEGLYSLFLFNTFLTKLQPWFLDNTPSKKLKYLDKDYFLTKKNNNDF